MYTGKYANLHSTNTVNKVLYVVEQERSKNNRRQEGIRGRENKRGKRRTTGDNRENETGQGK